MLGGTFKSVLAGWGAASAAEMFGFAGTIPAAVAGYVAGGPMGAVGGVGKGFIKGSSIVGGGTGGSQFYG